jgi:hypothetical protein
MSTQTSARALGFPPRQVLGEDLDGPGILALSHKPHAATDEIDKQAYIVVAAPGCRLIKRHAGDVGVIGAGTSPLDVMVDASELFSARSTPARAGPAGHLQELRDQAGIGPLGAGG